MESSYIPRSYSEILKASENGFYTITHNFGTYDIIFALYDDENRCVDYSQPEIKIKDLNSITIYWARAVKDGKYRIVIKF